MDKKITIAQDIDSPEIREKIWKIYEQSFAGKELECAQNQRCYDAQTFEAALTDPEYVKYYLEIDGKVIAYMLSTNNLEKAKITPVADLNTLDVMNCKHLVIDKMGLEQFLKASE